MDYDLVVGKVCVHAVDCRLDCPADVLPRAVRLGGAGMTSPNRLEAVGQVLALLEGLHLLLVVRAGVGRVGAVRRPGRRHGLGIAREEVLLAGHGEVSPHPMVGVVRVRVAGALAAYLGGLHVQARRSPRGGALVELEGLGLPASPALLLLVVEPDLDRDSGRVGQVARLPADALVVGDSAVGGRGAAASGPLYLNLRAVVLVARLRDAAGVAPGRREGVV